MAEILDNFEFESKIKYPWDEWLDGKVRLLKKGEDFDCETHSLCTHFRYQAKQRLLTPKTQIDGEHLYVQAIPTPVVVKDDVKSGTKTIVQNVNSRDAI